MTRTLAFSALFSLLSATGVASAQDAAAPEAAAPEAAAPEAAAPEAAAPEEQPRPQHKMNLSVAPPDAPLQRKAYNHEGFYLRVNVGPGFQYFSQSVASVSADETDFGLGTDVLIGGSPSPGMVLGGAVLGSIGFGSEVGLQYLAGPFFDAFPNSKDGWHIGLMLGAAGATQNSSVFGGGGALWAGYDLWVAPEWSVGFMVRGGGAYMAGDNQSLGTFTTVGLISIVYN